MLGSPYLSGPAACLRAGARNHRKHLLLPSKAPKAQTAQWDIKSLLLPWNNCKSVSGETAWLSDGRTYKQKELGKEISQEIESRQLTILFSAWWLHSEEHDTVFGALRPALERCTVAVERGSDEVLGCSHTDLITVRFKLTSQFQCRWFLLYGGSKKDIFTKKKVQKIHIFNFKRAICKNSSSKHTKMN